MTFKKVLLFPNPKGNVSENSIESIKSRLLEFGIESEVYVGTVGENFDAVIALGGDGTMLKAASIAFRHNVPIMSINFGTLGYMSGLEISELDLLSSLKSGCETEGRMLLSIEVEREGEIIANATALNEAVVSRSADGGIAQIGLSCDSAAVCDYRADGVIIATPTGSSAYAMSAGGPIIDTKLDAFCVCPICPHAIGARAMVFSPNSLLEIVSKNESGNKLIADGKAVCELKKGDIVRVCKSERTLEIIKLKKDAFYETLYKKMS